MSKHANVHINVTRKSVTYLYILGHPTSSELLFKDGALAVVESYTERTEQQCRYSQPVAAQQFGRRSRTPNIEKGGKQATFLAKISYASPAS